MKTSFLAILLLSVSIGSALASDHIDGPATTKHAITDLSDFYVFPTPNKAGYITLVANTHPMATEKNHFSDKVKYVFILREAKVQKDPLKILTTTKSEKTITCSFITPHNHDAHTSTCVTSNKNKRTVEFNEVDPTFDDSGLRVYTGLRADPFFFDAKWATKASTQGEISRTSGSNTMDKMNALSIVIDLDVTKLFGKEVSLVALVVKSTTTDPGITRTRQLDRLGRPEVTNVTMVAHEGDEDLRDQYNFDQPFKVKAANKIKYTNHIAKNVKFYDAIDDSSEWSKESANVYAHLIADDFLLVDVTKEAGETGYFTIESALLTGREHNTFGGRQLNDDIMDTLFTILINAGKGSTMTDGVDEPYRDVSDEFPYLADPDTSWKARLKAWAARKALGSK